MNKSKLTYYYDQEADIFYVSKGRPDKSDVSDEVKDGVVARYDRKTRQIKGFTILNFAKRTEKGSKSVPLPFNVNFSL